MSAPVNPALRIVHALDDPLRYRVLMQLMAGPATVSELIARTGAAQSKLSNHLAILRAAKIVSAERNGRRIAYTLAGPEIATVLETLGRISGPAPSAVPEIALARSCYDHVAGKLGVALFHALVKRGALRDLRTARPARKVRSGLGNVALGACAAAAFAELGIDIETVSEARRQFATACSDWTETAPHLGGALGAALQTRLLHERWLQRRGGTRALRITPAGRLALRERLGIDVDRLERPPVRDAG
jgi:DNA-binding transcriptional ArsR family regulator